MKTNKVGEIAEMKVAAAFAERGDVVSLPHGDTAPYDLIRDDGTLYTVQVKNGKLKDGKIEANLHTRYQKGGEWTSTTYSEETIDEFAIYCPDTDAVYRVPIEDAPKWTLTLRVSGGDGRSRNADEYKI